MGLYFYMHKWLKLESELRSAGYKYTCGLDEAGRGPLAGPVTVAAVILPDDFEDCGINDSKLLSEKNRLKFFEYIIANCKSYSIAHAISEEIDDINILQATFLAMRRAITNLNIVPDFVLVDGNLKIAKLKIPQKPIVSGDKKVISIACASILAKVTRDRLCKPDHHTLWIHHL